MNNFPLAQVVATHGALAAFTEASEEPVTYLARHAAGDWGEVCEDDAKENEFSLEKGFRILSAYTLKTGVKIWILTEADRSAKNNVPFNLKWHPGNPGRWEATMGEDEEEVRASSQSPDVAMAIVIDRYNQKHGETT